MRADYAAAYPDLYRRHWWWRVREELLLETVADTLAARHGQARILDVGCGAGLFFDALEQFGSVQGIESDAVAVAGAGRWRDRITVGMLDVSYRPEAAFDLVLLLDLLEHVEDPTTVLRLAGQVLRPGGAVLLTVPAYRWLWTSHDALNHHARRYSKTELTRTVAESGLSVQSVRFLFQSIVPMKLAVRACESLARVEPRVPRMPGPHTNQFLTSWYRTENRVGRRMPFGGSILLVATRASAQ